MSKRQRIMKFTLQNWLLPNNPLCVMYGVSLSEMELFL